MDRPWESERTIFLEVGKWNISPIGCENELDYLFKHISKPNLIRTARALGNEEIYKLGLYIQRC